MLKAHLERYILRGSLILLINHERPTKSGWWRAIYDGDLEDVYLILEKPLHKNFDINDPSLAHTHIEKNTFVIKLHNLKYSISNGEKKYEILAVIKGVESVILTQNNYDLSKIINDNLDFNNNILTSSGFTSVKDILLKKEKMTTLKEIVMNFE